MPGGVGKLKLGKTYIPTGVSKGVTGVLPCPMSIAIMVAVARPDHTILNCPHVFYIWPVVWFEVSPKYKILCIGQRFCNGYCMKILLTGAPGYIGKRLLPFLL